MKSIVPVVGAILLSGCHASEKAPSMEAPAPGWRIVRLADVPEDMVPRSLAIGPEGHHVAYVRTKGSGKQVVLDGQPGPVFNEIPMGRLSEFGPPRTPIHFSPDGRQVAYIAAVEGGQALVVNGKPEKTYTQIPLGALMFSEDSRHLAYFAMNGEKEMAVLDRIEGPAFDFIAEQFPKFSRDGRHFWYTARRGDRSVAVMDGKIIADWPYVGDLTLSPDESRVAFVYKDDDHWNVSVDGKSFGPYTGIGNTIYFSPDNRHVLFRAQHLSGDVIVIDGREHPRQGTIQEGQYRLDPRGLPFFILMKDRTYSVVHGEQEFGPYENAFGQPASSEGGEHFAFVAQRGGQVFMVLDGKEGPTFEELPSTPRFGPLGLHWYYQGRRGGKTMSVVDGVLADKDIYNVAFSPDGRHMALAVRTGLGLNKVRTHVELDGRDGPPFDVVNSMAFSDDGRRFVYIAHTQGEEAGGREEGKQETLMVDGRAAGVFDSIEPPEFSSDSRHIATLVKQGKDVRVWADGELSEPLEELEGGSRIEFDGPSRVYVLGIKSKAYVRLEREFPAR